MQNVWLNYNLETIPVDEGNTLTIEQITALINHKKDTCTKKDHDI